jgi:hypothetical protein
MKRKIANDRRPAKGSLGNNFGNEGDSGIRVPFPACLPPGERFAEEEAAANVELSDESSVLPSVENAAPVTFRGFSSIAICWATVGPAIAAKNSGRG